MCGIDQKKTLLTSANQNLIRKYYLCFLRAPATLDSHNLQIMRIYEQCVHIMCRLCRMCINKVVKSTFLPHPHGHIRSTSSLLCSISSFLYFSFFALPLPLYTLLHLFFVYPRHLYSIPDSNINQAGHKTKKFIISLTDF